jgi:hypothetical protein
LPTWSGGNGGDGTTSPASNESVVVQPESGGSVTLSPAPHDAQRSASCGLGR